MKLFGSLKELVNLVWRKDSHEITLRPSQSTTYTAARDVQLPPGDTAHVLVSATSTQTLTGKTIDGDDNTVQDLALSSLKTEAGDANEALVRDGSGAVISALLVDANIDAAAGINATKLGNGNVDNTELSLLNGLTGTIATDTNTVTLTNKTIAAADNTISGLLHGTHVDEPSSGVHGVTGTIVGTSDTQVLTNKDIDGGTASNTSRLTLPKASTATLSGLTRKEGTLVYDTDFDKPFFDNGTDLIEIGAGSGSGEINMISSPSTALGWAASGAGVTVATTTTSSELPLEGAIATAIKITNVSGTDYARFRFTMSQSLKQALLKIEFFQRTLSAFANDDMKVEMWTNSASDYSGTYTEVPLATDVSGDSPIKNEDGVYRTSFFADAEDYYELRIVRVAGTAALSIANVIVGPGRNALGAVTTEWQSFTPTFGGVSGGTQAGRYRRVGSNMEIYASVSNPTTWSGVQSFTVPFSLNINTTAVPVLNNTMPFGTATLFDTSGDDNYSGSIVYNSATDLRFVGADGGVAIGNNWSATYPFTKQNGSDQMAFHATIPIAEWAGSGTLNTGENDVEYAASTTGTWNAAAAAGDTIYGPEGAPITGALTAARIKTVRFRSTIQPTDIISVEYQTGGNWFPIENRYAYVAQGAADYGSQISSVSSTDVNVYFARYRLSTNATYGGAGTDWAASTRWRVVKRKAGVAVGFGQVTGSAAGLMPANLSNLDDVAATRMGLKEYQHGTTYNSGIAPTITGPAGLTVNYSRFFPYQTQSGSWRLRFNIQATYTSSSTAVYNVNGVTTAAANQAVSASQQFNSTIYTISAHSGNATSAVASVTYSGAITVGSVSGDIALGAKPTWAY